MKKVPSKLGLKKPQLNKVNSNLNNNLMIKKEEEIKIKHILNKKNDPAPFTKDNHRL